MLKTKPNTKFFVRPTYFENSVMKTEWYDSKIHSSNLIQGEPIIVSKEKGLHLIWYSEPIIKNNVQSFGLVCSFFEDNHFIVFHFYVQFFKTYFFFFLLLFTFSRGKYPLEVKNFNKKLYLTFIVLLERSRNGPYQLYLTFRVQSAGWVKLIQKDRRKCDKRSRRINDAIVAVVFYILLWSFIVYTL